MASRIATMPYHSLRDLGEAAGVSESHLSRILSGKRTPSRDVLGSLAEALQMSSIEKLHLLQSAGFAPPEHPVGDRILEELAEVKRSVQALHSRAADTRAGSGAGEEMEAPAPGEDNLVRLPLLERPAGLGHDSLVEDEIADYVTAPRETARDSNYVLRTKGASMEPEIHEGDLLFVRRQHHLDHPGQLCVVVSESSEGYCKRVWPTPDGRALMAGRTEEEAILNHHRGIYHDIKIRGVVVKVERYY